MRRIVLAAVLLLTACEDGPGAPRLVKDMGSAEGNLARRLADRFPAGTPEQDLVVALKADGFSVDEKARAASREWTRFPCSNYLDVQWKTDERAKVTVVNGEHRYTCV